MGRTGMVEKKFCQSEDNSRLNTGILKARGREMNSFRSFSAYSARDPILLS